MDGRRPTSDAVTVLLQLMNDQNLSSVREFFPTIECEWRDACSLLGRLRDELTSWFAGSLVADVAMVRDLSAAAVVRLCGHAVKTSHVQPSNRPAFRPVDRSLLNRKISCVGAKNVKVLKVPKSILILCVPQGYPAFVTNVGRRRYEAHKTPMLKIKKN
ncbi:unnamed protein product [Ceratitis capitata]|uniref:(Mediterranean fruit fly) hypothetical protein n=1 Tax=Ceratitis capitata TaxID=7213 RepID=A0A811VE20_CERCA|nr:unnamed protein product [Ceratitis capitata]